MAGYLSKTIGISCVFGKLRVLSCLFYVSSSNFFLFWWSDSRSARNQVFSSLRDDAVCLVACWTQSKPTNFSCLNFSHILYKLKMQNVVRGVVSSNFLSFKIYLTLKIYIIELWRFISQSLFEKCQQQPFFFVVPTAKRMLHSMNFPINQTRNQSITSFMVDEVKRRRRGWWRWRRSWRRYQNFS